MTNQEIEEAATQLTPENWEKLRRLLHQMFDELHNCEDLIRVLKLAHLSNLKSWYPVHFGKQQPEFMTLNEFVRSP